MFLVWLLFITVEGFSPGYTVNQGLLGALIADLPIGYLIHVRVKVLLLKSCVAAREISSSLASLLN